MSDGNGTALKLTRKDFVSGQEVRWCPGCGDYSILAQVQKALPDVEVPREKMVFVSGIGCSSRFPYYMNTYGFHGIHGRAPALASGIKLANPELMVWVATGDGDGLSIGGNHLIHAMRRNVDIKILLFNNRIYGLTKGQYSPTSEFGKKTKSSPIGVPDRPFNPLTVALAAEATFVARAIDVDSVTLGSVLRRAAEHKGTAFVEIYQNCNVFNDGAFEIITEKAVRGERLLPLEHGKPLVFGRQHKRGIRMRADSMLEVVDVGDDTSGLLVHDEARGGGYPFLLSGLSYPEFPEPVGVLRAVRRPTYEEVITEQGRSAVARQGAGTLENLIYSGDTWVVP